MKRPLLAAFLLAAFPGTFFGAPCSLTLQLTATNCPGGATLPTITLPGVFLDYNQCKGIQDLAVSLEQSFVWDPCSSPASCPLTCRVFYAIPAPCQPGCTGFLDFGAFDLNDPRLAGVIGNFTGTDITGGVGGLANDLGTTNNSGPEQGKPAFVSHATTANEGWLKQASGRARMREAQNRRVEQACRSGGGNFRYIMSPCQARALGKQAGLERAYNFMTPWFSAQKTKSEPVESPIGTLTGDFVPPATAGYEEFFLVEAGAVLEATQVPIAPDAAVPISGTGVTTGKPDTPPPPTPEPARKERGVSPCRKGWWLNSASNTCHASEPSCRAGSNDPGETCTVPDP